MELHNELDNRVQLMKGFAWNAYKLTLRTYAGKENIQNTKHMIRRIEEEAKDIIVDRDAMLERAKGLTDKEYKELKEHIDDMINELHAGYTMIQQHAKQLNGVRYKHSGKRSGKSGKRSGKSRKSKKHSRI